MASGAGQASQSLDERFSSLSADKREILDGLVRGHAKPARGPRLHIGRRSPAASAPLSFGQERLWFLDRLVPNNPWYNVNVAVRLDFAIDCASFLRALNEVVRRHEGLRTTFGEREGHPYQVIAPALVLEMPIISLRQLAEAEREPELMRIATEHATTPFDLATGPLIRTALVSQSEREHVFLLAMHHVICDAWSVGVFLNELTVLYSAFAAGRPSPLSELPVQYADFAVWQREPAQQELFAEQLRYWQDQLKGLVALNLPTDHARPAVQSYRGAYHMLKLDSPLSFALKSFSAREGVTVFMTLFTAFQILLHRYSGQDEIVTGVPVAGRNRPELEGLVGFFVNTLVMRINLAGKPTFHEALARVQATAAAAYARQDLPFEKLVEALQPERDPSRNPLFQLTFQFFHAAEAAHKDPGSAARHIRVHKGTANLDLALDLVDGPDGIGGSFEYSTDLFEHGTIARLASHYEALLRAIVMNPDRCISELPMLTESERRQIVIEWNRTEAEYPRDVCVHQLFEAQAAAAPNSPAIKLDQACLSYGELNERASQLAGYLVSCGAQPEDRVGIALDRCPDLAVAMLGVLKAGAAFVPLDPEYPRSRITFMLKDAGVKVLLTRRGLLDALPAHTARTICLDRDWPEIAHLAKSTPCAATSENLAYVIYTSGSTGTPKGVMIAHRALVNHLLWMQAALPLTPADRMLHKYSPAFDVAILEIFAPLIAGATVVLAKPGGQFDTGYLVELIARERITALDVVPALLEALLAESRIGACRSLRRVTCGGEELSPALRDRFFQILDAELHNLYGPTEATIGATWWTCTRGEMRSPVPIGRPISNTRLYVLDKHRQPVPAGVPGELYISGDGIARGYLNRPDLTAEKFIPSPLSELPGERLFATCDLARWRADGNCEFLGRMDDQVKVRGYRIEPGEIEARLREHSGVRDAIVMLVEEDTAVGRNLNHFTRRRPGFELSLAIHSPDFIQTVSSHQREWLVRQTLDECADDLQHLSTLAPRFVAGSERPQIRRHWQTSTAYIGREQLVIDGQQVMQEWERPVMQSMAGIVAASHGDVLEVGFGMGISAGYIQQHGVRRHTILECNADVAAWAARWRESFPDRDIRIVHAAWQEAVLPSEAFDAILFDTYPVSEEEFDASVLNSVTFAQSFFPKAASLLREGGVFTYYSNEIDSLSRRHQRLLLAHFRTFTANVVRYLKPPEDCNYWWADSMVIVQAMK